jgi:hypothetical protein
LSRRADSSSSIRSGSSSENIFLRSINVSLPASGRGLIITPGRPAASSEPCRQTWRSPLNPVEYKVLEARSTAALNPRSKACINSGRLSSGTPRALICAMVRWGAAAQSSGSNQPQGPVDGFQASHVSSAHQGAFRHQSSGFHFSSHQPFLTFQRGGWTAPRHAVPVPPKLARPGATSFTASLKFLVR